RQSHKEGPIYGVDGGDRRRKVSGARVAATSGQTSNSHMISENLRRLTMGGSRSGRYGSGRQIAEGIRRFDLASVCSRKEMKGSKAQCGWRWCYQAVDPKPKSDQESK